MAAKISAAGHEPGAAPLNEVQGELPQVSRKCNCVTAPRIWKADRRLVCGIVLSPP